MPLTEFCHVQNSLPSKSCVFVYWQRSCTALQQRASAKLCGVVQVMELPNFRRGRRLYSRGRPSRWASAHIVVQNILTLHLFWGKYNGSPYMLYRTVVCPVCLSVRNVGVLWPNGCMSDMCCTRWYMHLSPVAQITVTASCTAPALLTSGHCRMCSMQRHDSFYASGSTTASLPQFATFCTGFQFSSG